MLQLGNRLITDRLLEQTGWPVIFDQEMHPVGDKTCENEAKALLYDKRIFGLTQWSPEGEVCQVCEMTKDGCMGHFALWKLKETFRYFLPQSVKAVTFMYKKKFGCRKKSEWNSACPILKTSMIMRYLQSNSMHDVLEDTSSVYVIVLPLSSRIDYMNETRFSKRQYCQYLQLLATLMNNNYGSFVRQMERMYTTRNKNICMWDMSQVKSFKRLVTKPSVVEVLSGKGGFVRKHCLGGRADLTSRQVAIPCSQVEIDEIGVNSATFEALGKCKKVIVGRQPTLYRTNTMLMKLKELKDLDAYVHAFAPEICKSFNLDFDGDETVIYAFTGDPKDRIFNTPQSFLTCGFVENVCSGSYNVPCCVFMLSAWPRRLVRQVVADRLMHTARERNRPFPDTVTRNNMRRRDVLRYLAGTLCSDPCVSVGEFLLAGWPVEGFKWTRDEWEALCRVAIVLRKRGTNMDYLYDFKTCTKIMNAFVFFHCNELTVKCSNFEKAHLSAKRDLATIGRDLQVLTEKALHWFPKTAGERIIVESKCKGTRENIVQGVCVIGNLTVRYFIEDFLKLCEQLDVEVVSKNDRYATVWINSSYYEGLTAKERYVVSIAGREGPVTSIVNTPDGGYGRRKTSFVALGLTTNYLRCSQVGGVHATDWYPPLFNSKDYEDFLHIRLSRALHVNIKTQRPRFAGEAIDSKPTTYVFDRENLKIASLEDRTLIRV